MKFPTSLISGRYALAAVIVAAIAVRAAVGLSLDNRIYFPDSVDYVKITQNILAGEGPKLSDTSVAKRGPGYSYFLAPIFYSFQNSPDAPPLLEIRLIQALLGGLLCFVIYAIAKRLFSPPVGLVAAAFVAFDPFLTYFSGLVLTESLFAVLLAGGVLFLLYSKERLVYALASGLLLGAASLVRPSILLLIPVLLLAWILLNRLDRSIAARSLLIGVAALSVLLPWGMRNQRLTGHFVLTTLSAGGSLYEGVYPGADGGPAMDKINWPAEIKGMPEAEKDAFLKHKAIEWIKSDPLRVAKLAPIKLWRFWSIFPNFSQYKQPLYMAISACFMVPMLLLTVVGVILSRKKLRDGWLLLLPALYFSSLHMIFVGSIRYRSPVMPFLAIFAAYAAVHSARYFAEERSHAALSGQ